jgi:hypothetical protein
MSKGVGVFVLLTIQAPPKDFGRYKKKIIGKFVGIFLVVF